MVLAPYYQGAQSCNDVFLKLKFHKTIAFLNCRYFDKGSTSLFSNHLLSSKEVRTDNSGHLPIKLDIQR